jgi:hypothetical protein
MSMTPSWVHRPSALIGGRSNERTVRCAMCCFSIDEPPQSISNQAGQQHVRRRAAEEGGGGVQRSPAAGNKAAAAAPKKIARARERSSFFWVARQNRGALDRTHPVQSLSDPREEEGGKRKTGWRLFFEREGLWRGAKR